MPGETIPCISLQGSSIVQRFLKKKGSRTMRNEIKLASSDKPEDLMKVIYSTSADVLSILILNRNLTEDMAIAMAGRRDLASEILTTLANDKRWRDSHGLLSAVCNNPKTPSRVAIAMLKKLRIFDLADLARNHHIAGNVKKKVELEIVERIPSLPPGIKKTLARRGSGNIVLRLLQEDNDDTIRNCLDNPQLTEAHLHKAMYSPLTSLPAINMIATHPKWSLRYPLRYALIRNNRTLLQNTVGFLAGMKSTDLKDLYNDPTVPKGTKPYIYNELLKRGIEEKPLSGNIE